MNRAGPASCTPASQSALQPAFSFRLEALPDDAAGLVSEFAGLRALTNYSATCVDARAARLPGTHLTRVKLNSTELHSTFRESVGPFSQLRLLEANSGTELTNTDLRLLVQHAKLLENLTVRSSLISDDGLGRLAALLHLRVLDLSNSQHITDAGLDHLCGLPLHSLAVDNCLLVTAAGVAAFRSLTNLSMCGIGINRLDTLAAMPRLAMLDLGECVFSRPGLFASLRPLDSLRTLRVSESNWCDQDISDMEGCSLRVLEADETPIAGVGLRGFRRLRYLEVSDCQFLVDDALLGLSSELALVNIVSCDSLTDAALDHLQCYPTLQAVALESGGGITAEAVAALRQARQDVVVIDNAERWGEGADAPTAADTERFAREEEAYVAVWERIMQGLPWPENEANAAAAWVGRD